MCTFGHERVLPRASQCAVNLANKLHVVQERIEGIEVREADHVRGTSSGSLAERRKAMHIRYGFISRFFLLKIISS